MQEGAAGSPFVVAEEISRITVKCGKGPLPAMTSAPAQVSFGGGAEGTACARFHTSTPLKRQSRLLRLPGRRMARLFITTSQDLMLRPFQTNASRDKLTVRGTSMGIGTWNGLPCRP